MARSFEPFPEYFGLASFGRPQAGHTGGEAKQLEPGGGSTHVTHVRRKEEEGREEVPISDQHIALQLAQVQAEIIETKSAPHLTPTESHTA